MSMKAFMWLILTKVLKLYTLLPIENNKIIFISYGGNQYSCNPKYISDFIISKYPSRYNIIWAFKDPKNHSVLEHRGIKKVSVKSFEFIKEYYTSKVVVINDMPPPFLEKRKKQFAIQTWHGGGAYKKVGRSAEVYSEATLRRVTNNTKNIDLYLSSCEKFTEEFVRDTCLYDGEVLEKGMPRNDFLINQTRAKNKVRKVYNIPHDNVVVLYAPTFREQFNSETYNIDFIKLCETIERKYKRKCTILHRVHHKIRESHKFVFESNQLIDVSQYLDMQEILYDTDILITDYSSSMWDFSLMYKPCFIFATDIEDYRQERDFHTPIKEWPFPIASNNKELSSNINSFDKAKYDIDVKNHHESLGNFETGHATEAVVEYIIKALDN